MILVAQFTEGGHLHVAQCFKGGGTEKCDENSGWLILLGENLAAHCCKGPWYPGI